MKTVITGTLSIITILFSMTASAETEATGSGSGFGVGVHAGTLGYGFNATYGLADSLNIRGQYNTIGLDADENDAGIDYNYDLDWNSYGLLLDWHPFSGGFRISAGYYINNNEITGTADGVVDVNGTNYTSSLRSDITFDSSAPYVGIGWGNAAEKGDRLSFMFEIGALLQGEPQVTLTETSAVPVIPQSDLDAEAAEAQADISEFDVYPVIALGLAYQF